MIEKEIEKRQTLTEKQNFLCAVCGKPLGFYSQLAHILGNTKLNRKISIRLVGKDYIDSIYNAKMVCSLECNKKVDIGKLNEIKIKEHLECIEKLERL